VNIAYEERLAREVAEREIAETRVARAEGHGEGGLERPTEESSGGGWPHDLGIGEREV